MDIEGRYHTWRVRYTKSKNLKNKDSLTDTSAYWSEGSVELQISNRSIDPIDCNSLLNSSAEALEETSRSVLSDSSEKSDRKPESGMDSSSSDLGIEPDVTIPNVSGTGEEEASVEWHESFLEKDEVSFGTEIAEDHSEEECGCPFPKESSLHASSPITEVPPILDVLRDPDLSSFRRCGSSMSAHGMSAHGVSSIEKETRTPVSLRATSDGRDTEFMPDNCSTFSSIGASDITAGSSNELSFLEELEWESDPNKGIANTASYDIFSAVKHIECIQPSYIISNVDHTDSCPKIFGEFSVLENIAYISASPPTPSEFAITENLNILPSTQVSIEIDCLPQSCDGKPSVKYVECMPATTYRSVKEFKMQQYAVKHIKCIQPSYKISNVDNNSCAKAFGEFSVLENVAYISSSPPTPSEFAITEKCKLPRQFSTIKIDCQPQSSDGKPPVKYVECMPATTYRSVKELQIQQ